MREPTIDRSHEVRTILDIRKLTARQSVGNAEELSGGFKWRHARRRCRYCCQPGDGGALPAAPVATISSAARRKSQALCRGDIDGATVTVMAAAVASSVSRPHGRRSMTKVPSVKTIRRGGRPKRKPKPGERVQLGLRVTPALKKNLDAAAEQSGRSQSQETELRLERSFDRQGLISDALELAFGREAGGLGLAVTAVMNVAGRSAAHWKAEGTGVPREKRVAWIDDPYAYDQAMRAAIAMLEQARPEGDPAAPEYSRKEGQDENLPKLYVNELILSLRGEALGTWAESIIGQSNFDAIKTMLGGIVERLKAGEYRLVRTVLRRDGTGDKNAR
jgi:hypothetical protein